jgi:FAD binding domain
MKPELISKMKANLRGRVILPGDQNYNEARKVYNGMIDKHPKLIVYCVNAADVRLAVEFARENELVLAVRGGGHNGAGLATCDDGMVIDLSQMKGVRFDPSSSTIRAEPGCTQGDVNHLGQSFGVAVPAGVVSTTGIAGLTLGGFNHEPSDCRRIAGSYSEGKQEGFQSPANRLFKLRLEVRFLQPWPAGQIPSSNWRPSQVVRTTFPVFLRSSR